MSINRTFIRHYVEMVLAMFAGMAVLGIPADYALRAAGSSSAKLGEEAPAAMLLLMAVTMTVPMVALMRYRGHGWRPCSEMAGAMFAVTFAAIALMAASVIGYQAAMAIEHVAMLPAMFAVMLLRPHEYSGHGGRHRATEVAEGAAA